MEEQWNFGFEYHSEYVFLKFVLPCLGITLCLASLPSKKPTTCLKRVTVSEVNSDLEESDVLIREDMSRVGGTHAQWLSYNVPCCVSLINPIPTYTFTIPVANLVTYSEYSLFYKFEFPTGDSIILFGKIICVRGPCWLCPVSSFCTSLSFVG
jgi:hypothetical protein